jgi:hypothetical protein
MLEKKILLNMLSLHNTNRIDYNNRKWETIKFFQSINTAIIAGAIVGLYTIAGKGPHLSVRIAITCLPLLAILSSILAISNLRRESRLLYLEELQMFKIAKLLGLDIDIRKKYRWLKCDTHLLLDKWRLSTHGTGDKAPVTAEEWLDRRTKGHRFAHIFNWLFLLQIMISAVLIVLLVFVKL